MQKKVLNNIFYVSLFLSYLFILLPNEYKLSVYSPNLLGLFFLIIIFPALIISLIWLSFLDTKNRKWGSLFKRLSLFFIIILISFLFK